MSGDAAKAAPCRHAGTPPENVVNAVSLLIQSLSDNEKLLQSSGLTVDEYNEALPAAIEALRGSGSASNSDRREFLRNIFENMRDRELITDFIAPKYGKHTVYKLITKESGAIAVIQKGCPDGHHSSLAWSIPDWADEAYLWWVCDSTAYQPGEHVSKGIQRLGKKLVFENTRPLDGVIFHSGLCGTLKRPCPKIDKVTLGDKANVPAPCVYTLSAPKIETAGTTSSNSRTLKFPSLLLSLFGVKPELAAAHIGSIGLKLHKESVKATITSRYGSGRSTTHRS